MAFQPDGKRVYVVMEMGVSVVCYKITEKGLEKEAEYPLIKGSFTREDSAADIHFTKDGSRLYATVRGKNLISAFNVRENFSLELIGSFPTFGDSPRNFCLTPDEKYLVIAHQVSGHVVVCPVEKDGGAGSKVCSVILPGASCIINA